MLSHLAALQKDLQHNGNFARASLQTLEKARKKKKAGKQCLHQENKKEAAVTASELPKTEDPLDPDLRDFCQWHYVSDDTYRFLPRLS